MDQPLYEAPNLLALCLHKWPTYYDYVMAMKVLTQEFRCACGWRAYLPIGYNEEGADHGAFVFTGVSDRDNKVPDVNYVHYMPCGNCSALLKFPNLKV